MRNLEQELKMRLDERSYNLLLSTTQQKPQLQTNFYFCGKQFNKDVMVRVRQKGETYVLCAKKRYNSHNGVFLCDEREVEITKDYAISLCARGISPQEFATLLNLDFAEHFHFVGQLQTYRTKFDFLEWTLEVDKNFFLDTIDYELECECNDVQKLEKLKAQLAYQFGIPFVASVAKSQRFHDRLEVLKSQSNN